MMQINIRSIAEVVGQVTRTAPQASDRVRRLQPGEAKRIRRTGQTLHIVSGAAWVTINGRDVILQSGEDVKLPWGRHPAVISGLRGQPVAYQLG